MDFKFRDLTATAALALFFGTACGQAPDPSKTQERRASQTVDDVFRGNPLCAYEDRYEFSSIASDETPGSGDAPSFVLDLDDSKKFSFSVPAGAVPASPWKACGIVIAFGGKVVSGSESTIGFALRRGLGYAEGADRITSEPAQTMLVGVCEDSLCIARSGRIHDLLTPTHMNGSRWALTFTNGGDEAIEVVRPSLIVVGMKP